MKENLRPRYSKFSNFYSTPYRGRVYKWKFCPFVRPSVRLSVCPSIPGLVSGVDIVVWGLQWGSGGSLMADTWPIASNLPQVGWDERRKGAFGSFERVLLVLTLLESS